MPKFDAGAVVEPLDYDFTKFVPKCEGTITEPTDDQITLYFTEMRKLAAEARKHDRATAKAIDLIDEDADDPVAAIAALDDAGVALEMGRRLAGITARLCSGQPSAEQLLKLPSRIRNVFYQWLQGEITDPEVASGATSAQVTTLRTAAAG